MISGTRAVSLIGRGIGDLDFNEEIPLGHSLISLSLSLERPDAVGDREPNPAHSSSR